MPDFGENVWVAWTGVSRAAGLQRVPAVFHYRMTPMRCKLTVLEFRV